MIIDQVNHPIVFSQYKHNHQEREPDVAASLVGCRNHLVKIKVFHWESLLIGFQNINHTVLILNINEKAYLSMKNHPFQMIANLLSLKTNLAALQTMQTLWSKEYLKIAIDLSHISIGLHNYNMIIRL